MREYMRQSDDRSIALRCDARLRHRRDGQRGHGVQERARVQRRHMRRIVPRDGGELQRDVCGPDQRSYALRSHERMRSRRRRERRHRLRERPGLLERRLRRVMHADSDQLQRKLRGHQGGPFELRRLRDAVCAGPRDDRRLRERRVRGGRVRCGLQRLRRDGGERLRDSDEGDGYRQLRWVRCHMPLRERGRHVHRGCVRAGSVPAGVR